MKIVVYINSCGIACPQGKFLAAIDRNGGAIVTAENARTLYHVANTWLQGERLLPYRYDTVAEFLEELPAFQNWYGWTPYDCKVFANLAKKYL